MRSFVDYEESPGVNLRGNTPVFAPRHTFNLWTGYDWSNGLRRQRRRALSRQDVRRQRQHVRGRRLRRAESLRVRYRRGAVEYQLNINNVTDTKYFVPHQDYLQVYPGSPVNVLGTIRVRLK